MAEFMALDAAIGELIPDDASVAMEGFTHLIPTAAGHELIRQGKRGLTLIRMTPDIIYDQIIGMGCASRLVFSWGGNPGVGSLHRLRDAVENGYPGPIELEEHSHAGMAARYTAGASGLPFGILRGYIGGELADHTNVATVRSPFDDSEVTAVPALNPDVAVIHAQQADRRGNVGLWGITGVQREVALASRRVLVTVEEIVPDLDLRGPNGAVLPAWTVDAVVAVPRGSHPSYSMGYTERDNSFYTKWDAISRDRQVFTKWMETYVTGAETFDVYLAALDDDTLTSLVDDE